jgi:hypothetical protein
MMEAVVHILRVRPGSDDVSLTRLFVEARLCSLELPGRGSVEVFRLFPLDVHSKAEQKYIEETFPYFQSRIIPDGGLLPQEIGGYLLTAIPGRQDDTRFDSYFPLAEAMLENWTR